jgi:hypothetical protein
LATVSWGRIRQTKLLGVLSSRMRSSIKLHVFWVLNTTLSSVTSDDAQPDAIFLNDVPRHSGALEPCG